MDYSYVNTARYVLPTITIFVPEFMKQSRPRHHLKLMVLSRYPDQEICVVNHLEQYVEKVKDLPKDQNFFISFVKPHPNA